MSKVEHLYNSIFLILYNKKQDVYLFVFREITKTNYRLKESKNSISIFKYK